MSRLLLVAPTIDGTDVGEAWVAYNWAIRLSQRHDTTVLTYSKRGAVSAHEQLPNARVVEWREPPGLGRHAERFNSLLKPGYLAFHLRARRWITQALEAGEKFDVAHQVTPVAMRYPSPLSTYEIPYIIGPVGGGLASPPAFVADESSNPWYMRLRSIDGWRLRHDPSLRLTYEAAACVLGIAPYVQQSLSHVSIRRLEIMSETAVTALPAVVDRTGRQGQPVRLLHVGRLIRTKGVRDVISAMAHLDDLDVTLDVVGDGPDRTSCETAVDELRLPARITFHGRRDRSKIDEFYRRADIFVFPSYREPGGNVQFEAMSFGLPLIVSDRGGPAAAVDSRSALLVHPDTPTSYGLQIASAIRQLAIDPGLRATMGAAARDRVAAVGTWEGKLNMIDRLYDEVSRK